MSYKVSDGLSESELKSFLNDAYKKYGLYGDKAINYTYADIAPVVMCTVTSRDKILIAKRSLGLADAEGYWSTINGFIDEIKPVKEFARQEVREELGIKVPLREIRVGRSYIMKNPKEKRAYIVFPCLVDLKIQHKIKLNYEHTEYAWISRDKLETYHILEDLPLVIDSALKLKT